GRGRAPSMPPPRCRRAAAGRSFPGFLGTGRTRGRGRGLSCVGQPLLDEERPLGQKRRDPLPRRAVTVEPVRGEASVAEMGADGRRDLLPVVTGVAHVAAAVAAGL